MRSEGNAPATEPIDIPLSNRPSLKGEATLEAPFTPHLWGVTGDVVVTLAGDLTPDQLRSVAGSLRAR